MQKTDPALSTLGLAIDLLFKTFLAPSIFGAKQVSSDVGRPANLRRGQPLQRYRVRS
jgi:hypothetical protein